MKFVRTINYCIINWDEVSHVDYENIDDAGRYYPYIHLKNKSKFDFFESVDTFNIEENADEYIFCPKCVTVHSELLLRDIQNSFDNGLMFYDIEESEDRIWEEFIEWAKTEPKLSKKIRS